MGSVQHLTEPVVNQGKWWSSVTNQLSSRTAGHVHHGRRILFVNADADFRAVVTRVLQREGFRVEAAAHSGHALLLCRTTAFDAVVSELCGPDISGPSLVEQMRRHQPSIAAVYLGTPGSPDGVDHLLVRPFTKDDLVERIEFVLSGVAA
jgi:DNA-binding response OmpR family regulator